MKALQLTLDMSQRWLFGKPKYRPSRETIRPADYEVAEIPDDTTARNFIREHHYSGSMGAARVRVGLYRHGVLVGVAVFSHPCSDAVLTHTFCVPPASAVELGRFVLLNEVEANAESFFLGRAFDVLRSRGLLGVVTFSDPVPRRSATGDLILPGHCGIAFQAHNGIYLGRGTPRTLRLLPNGRVLHSAAPDLQPCSPARIFWIVRSSSSLQHLEERYPVHARGFHRDSINLARLQPISCCMQVFGKRWKAPHRLRIALRWNRYIYLRCPDIYADSIRLQTMQVRC